MDNAMPKTMDAVMYEQRVEVMKQEEELDDIMRIVMYRDEIIQEQLHNMMNETRMLKMDEAREELNNNLKQTKSLLERDEADGHQTIWTQVLANRDKTAIRQDGKH